MKSYSPQRMAIIMSLIASLITAFGIFGFLKYSFEEIYLQVAIIMLSIFIVNYVIAFYMLNKFLFEKILPIYKTVHGFSASDKELLKQIENTDIVKVIESEVQEWTNQKTTEINQLREMEKYRKEFIGNVSHELKTPVFNIQGYVLTLLDGGLEDESINRKYLERASDSINRMTSILTDLDEISKLESGTLHLNQTAFDIVELIQEVVDSLDISIKENNIKIVIDSKPEKELSVEADRKWIFQVLNNLISNAIKYGNKDCEIKFGFTDMHDRLLIEVKDNGVGIPKESLPRLFERFYRVDKSRARTQGGSGLGLAIVKHILEAHKQTIQVSSKLGVGTSFLFTLYRAK